MFDLIAQRRRPEREDQPLNIQGFSRGLNSYDAHRAVRKDELVSALNYYLNRRGDLTPRPGLTQFTTVPLDGNAYSCDTFRIANELFTIVCTTTFKVYKVSSTGVPTLLGTTAGLAEVFVYSNWCVVCDGSYLKYVDKAGNLVLAYDAGEDNELYDKIDETSDGAIKIHTGQTRAGVKITFPTFTDSFKIPVVEIKARLTKVGSPTGTIQAKLYQGTSLLATSSNSYDVLTLLTTEQTYTFNFTVDNADQSGWMESNVAYRFVLEYDGGDASNCIELATIDDDDLEGTNFTTVWVDSLSSPLMWLAPNLPPKASFGKTTLKRPFLAGDPDNPGWLWYGNVSILDWSTPNGGGWLGAVDDSRTSYPIGGIGSMYGELYAFGKEEAPYLSKLTGNQPSEYQLLDSFKAVAAPHKTIVDRPNDIWFSRASGANDLLGVDGYGSTRTYSQAALVLDKFEEYWDDAKINIAGFIEKLNLYLLHINGSDRVLVCHTALPYQRSNVANDIGHPWTEFKFPTAPTLMSRGKSDFLVGLEDNHLYKLDFTAIDDGDEVPIEFNWRTAFIDFPFYNVDLNTLHTLGASRGGLSFDMNIYTEANDEDIVRTINVSLGSSGLLVQAATMLVSEATFLVQRNSLPPVFPLNIRCSTVQLEGDGLIRYFYEPAVISGALLKYKTLEN